MRVYGFPTGTEGLDYHRVFKPLKAMAKHGVETKWFGGKGKRDEKWFDLPYEKLGEARDWADALFIKCNFNSKTGVLTESLGSAVDAAGELVRYKPVIVDMDDDINVPVYHPVYESRMKNKRIGRQVVELDNKAYAQSLEDERFHEGGAHDLLGKNVQYKGKNYLYWNSDPDTIFRQMLESADMTVVSTDYLADLYRKYAKKIVVLPNGIDFEDVKENRKKNDGKIRLGLIGSTSHGLDYISVMEIMKELLDEFPNLILVTNGWAFVEEEDKKLPKEQQRHKIKPQPGLVGAGLDKHPRVEVHDVSNIWGWYDYLAEKGLDLFAAPLVNDKFNKGKSNLKLLEHGAMKVPGVFSYHGPYKYIHKAGVGLTGRDSKEFHGALRKLIKDKVLREDLGEKAYAHVKKHFDMREIGKKYVSEFKKLVDDFQSVKGTPDLMYQTA